MEFEFVETLDLSVFNSSYNDETGTTFYSDNPKHERLARRLDELTRRLITTGLVPSGWFAEIYFTLTGKTAGHAKRKWNGPMLINLNTSLIETNFDEILNNTLPHEVAHLVTFVNHPGVKVHGPEWKYYCILLGGDGNRCHNMDVKPAKRHTKYLYKTNSGHEVQVGKAVHNKIQNGQLRKLHATKEIFGKNHYLQRCA